MGATKQLLMEAEELRDTALRVLCKAGALKECEYHSGFYMEANEDLQTAYKVANARITAGEIHLPAGFSRRDFTDMIKDAFEAYGSDSCSACDKIFNED